MNSLIQNELIKIYEKKSAWIYKIIIFLIVLIGGIIYQQALVGNSNWHFMNDFAIGGGVLVTLFAVIVSSSNISAEFSDGTIKQLLIRPHRRGIILLSKYIAVLIYSLILTLTFMAATFIVGWFLFGSGSFTTEILVGNKMMYIGEQYFLKMLYLVPGLVIFTTISFMLSTFFKNQAIAVGISIFTLFISATIGALIALVADKFTWMKYLIFPHLDITVFARQETILNNITLPISLSILAVYYVIFMVVLFRYFEKKDIIV